MAAVRYAMLAALAVNSVAFMGSTMSNSLTLMRSSTSKTCRAKPACVRTKVAPLRMASSTDAQYGKSFTVEATEEHTATVIWLHGLGDSGKEWTKLASAISVPWAKFVFPTAARQESTICEGATMNSWYDITGLGVKELRADEEGIRKSIEHIHSLLKAEIEAGTPSERIIVGGFSQGGCVAIAAAMTFEQELGGVMAVSSWYPRGVADTPTPANKKLPVMLCHGEVDPIAKVEWSRKAFEYLLDMDMPAEGNVYPGVGHEFTPAEVTDMKEFIQRNCPPTFTVKIQKPLGAVMEEAEYPLGAVKIGSLKEGGNAEKSGKLQVGDQIVRINGQLVRTQGFDQVMESLVAAESEVELKMVRPIPDRDADWASLSGEEQERRYKDAGGVIKVCSDGPCSKQGAKNVIRWLKELTPPEFSVSRCGCTGNCGNGPNLVIGGKGKEDRVLYGVNTVGKAVKMLREEYQIQTDPVVVQRILNPSKIAEFGISDELVRQGILASVTIRGSFETNRF